MQTDNYLEQYRKIHTDENGIFENLKKQHKKDPYTVKDQIKKQTKVCFVFSCPGREELLKDKVCSGETGDNLDILLGMLNKENKELFPCCKKEEYDILNASDVVHFYALDKKTEAGKLEIEERFSRIEEYIKGNKGLEYIILFGKKAELLRNKILKYDKIKIKIINDIPHLGYQSLNQIIEFDGKKISEENYPTPEERTKARISVVAKKILKQIKGE